MPLYLTRCGHRSCVIRSVELITGTRCRCAVDLSSFVRSRRRTRSNELRMFGAGNRFSELRTDRERYGPNVSSFEIGNRIETFVRTVGRQSLARSGAPLPSRQHARSGVDCLLDAADTLSAGLADQASHITSCFDSQLQLDVFSATASELIVDDLST